MVCAQAPQGARHSFTWRFRPQVYHSTMNERPDVQVVCGCSILPIKTTCRGPAPPCSEGAGHCPRNPCCASFAHARTLAAPPPPYPHSAPPLCVGEDDIIDEVLGFFKANVLFKQFEVKGPADRVLIYMTLYTTQCLSKLTTCATKAEGVRALTSMAHETFRIPGEAGFPLGSFFPSPENSQEAGARARCARDGGGDVRVAGKYMRRARDPGARDLGLCGDPEGVRHPIVSRARAGWGKRCSETALQGVRGAALAAYVDAWLAPRLRPADLCRGYFKQMREEMGRRVISKVYAQDDGAPSKFWLVFAKRKFMNKALV